MKITTHNISRKEYDSVHTWLRWHHGKAVSCVAPDCSGKSNSFEWALIKGKRYEKNIDNYIHLCKSCHSKYDLTDLARKNLGKLNSSRNIQVIQYDLKGNKIAEYKSFRNAMDTSGIGDGIRHVARGNQKTAGGFIWRIKSDSLEPREEEGV